jgi:glycosyltransferase involved in cell wall biosynthesis
MRPLKIALLSRWYWLESCFHDDEEGGATRQLAEAIAAMGHEVIVLSQSPEVRKLKQIELGTLETWVFPREKHRDIITAWRDRMARKKFNYSKVYSDALMLKDFLSRRGPFDAIWAHSESTDGLITAIAAQLKIKLPPVLLQVQALHFKFEKGMPVFTNKLPIDIALRQASRILANSEMAAGALSTYAGRGHTEEDLKAKVRVVYPNIQRAFLRAAQEDPPVPAPMKDRVLFLGSLTRNKGALLFLKALPKTEASKRNSTFAVIGDFTEYNRRFIRRWEEAKEITRVQLKGARMEYLGRVSTSEVIRQIRLARVVVIPSLFETFSRGVVEALILGRPVIATDKVGAAQLLNTHQCGIVIPPNDDDALAQAIDVVLSPVVSFTENAERVGQNLSRELAPEAIAPVLAYHLGRVAGEIVVPAKPVETPAVS